MSFKSNSFAPRKTSKLYKLVNAMVKSGREWSYIEMAEFGFNLNHTRTFHRRHDRGYWSVNIRFAKDSYYIDKNDKGLYFVTETCKRAM